MCGSGKMGIVHGYKSLFLLDEDGQVQATHSISAGLDYPGIGPQLAALGKKGRIEFTEVTDGEALQAVQFFAKNEGLIFALEPAHAGAVAIKLAKTLTPEKSIIVTKTSLFESQIVFLRMRSQFVLTVLGYKSNL